MSKQAVVYWLIPAKEKGKLFRQLIRILSRELNAPRFEPHLTLLVAPADGPAPAKILRLIRAAPIRLRVRGISSSSALTKTLFARFESNKPLQDLVADLQLALNMRTRRPGDPHLSLVYKTTSVAVRKELAAIIRLPFREVTFDAIKAVRCELPIRDAAAIEAWRTVALKRLRVKAAGKTVRRRKNG